MAKTSYGEGVLPRVGSERRVGRLILIGTAVSVLVGLLAAVIYFVFQTKAVSTYFGSGSEEFDKAVAITQKSADLATNFEIVQKPDQVKATTKVVLKSLPEAKTNLKSSIRNFDLMGDVAFSKWEMKVASLSQSASEETLRGVQSTEEMLKRVGILADVLVQLRQASDKYSQAFTKNNEAVTLNNGDHYAEGRAAGEEAVKLFGESKALIGQAAGMDESLGLATYVNQVGNAEQWANNSIKMADAGNAKNFDEYNKLVESNNVLDDEVLKTAKSPIMTTPEDWARRKLDDTTKQVRLHFDRGDRLRRQAVRTWNRNT